METNSTQAVSADTTAQTTVVKRLRRGDVREDGMVFWAHDKKARSGECWVTPFIFQKKRLRETARQRIYKEKNRKTVEDREKAWRQANKERIKKAHAERYLRNKEDRRLKYFENRSEILAKRRQKRQENAEKIRQADRAKYRSNPEEKIASSKRWAERNPDKRRKAKAAWVAANPDYEKRKRVSDPLFALTGRVRSRVRGFLRNRGIKKSARTAHLLGCTYAEFRDHIESKFLPGMSWENRHLWHIDHIVPCKVGKTKEQIEALFHFTNLRPIWGPDNQSKSSKLPEEHELPENLHTKVKEIYLTAKARSA